MSDPHSIDKLSYTISAFDRSCIWRRELMHSRMRQVGKMRRYRML